MFMTDLTDQLQWHTDLHLPEKDMFGLTKIGNGIMTIMIGRVAIGFGRHTEVQFGLRAVGAIHAKVQDGLQVIGNTDNRKQFFLNKKVQF
jgi:hypothetical protein